MEAELRRANQERLCSSDVHGFFKAGISSENHLLPVSSSSSESSDPIMSRSSDRTGSFPAIVDANPHISHMALTPHSIPG